jgi:transcriptional regulator with PAS, ATPase and Fis domain
LVLQPKLLRVIQERSIERIAGIHPLPIDVRIIAATNRDLEKMVCEGKFREDLYYRLNVIPLTIPPLRFRSVDIPLYIDYFLDKFMKTLQKGTLKIDEPLRRWLMNYHWPGNVRQLEHVIEYLVNIAQEAVLTLQELPSNLMTDEGQVGLEIGLEQQLAECEKQLLRTYIPPGATLADKKQVAKRLKISLATLYRKLEKYQLQ